jgi:hypothetical protein
MCLIFSMRSVQKRVMRFFFSRRSMHTRKPFELWMRQITEIPFLLGDGRKDWQIHNFYFVNTTNRGNVFFLFFPVKQNPFVTFFPKIIREFSDSFH